MASGREPARSGVRSGLRGRPCPSTTRTPGSVATTRWCRSVAVLAAPPWPLCELTLNVRAARKSGPGRPLSGSTMYGPAEVGLS